MKSMTTNWRSTLILIATGMLFLLLAIAEVMAAPAEAGAADAVAPWASRVRAMDEALARKDVRAARYEWQGAYGAALGSRRWDALVEVGDARLRIGRVAGDRKAAEPMARRLYLAAFFLARQQGSLDGALVTAEAFARLGDQEVSRACLGTAERIAARAPGARAADRVIEVRKRLTLLQGP